MRALLQQFLTFARRNPVIVVSLAVIVVMGSASYYLWQRQQSLSFNHEEVRRSGEDMLQSLTGQVRVNTEIATVTDALNFIDRNLINEADLADNLGYFYSIESAAHLRFSQLNQLSSQPQPPGSVFKPVPFSLRATGPYRQVMRLLHEMESGPRLLRIRTYTFSSSDAGTGPAPAGPGAADAATDSVTLEMTVDLLAHP